MDHFLKNFFPDVYKKMKGDSMTSNYCKFDSQLLTFFTSSLYIAGLVASLCASPVTRAFGRKSSILLGGIAFLAGSVIGGAAYNLVMLMLARALLGVGIGFANQVSLSLQKLGYAYYEESNFAMANTKYLFRFLIIYIAILV